MKFKIGAADYLSLKSLLESSSEGKNVYKKVKMGGAKRRPSLPFSITYK
jgi:hypothetical protein